MSPVSGGGLRNNRKPRPPIVLTEEKKMADRNLLRCLKAREYINASPNVRAYHNRSLYEWLVPGYSETKVETPPCYLRKFTPDGQFLVAFSYDQKSVLVYRFLGSPKAQSLYNYSQQPQQDISQIIFDHVFQLVHSILIADGQELLHRECMLFAGDGRFLIVASFFPCLNYAPPNFYEIFQNNESLSFHQNYGPEDSTLCVVDLHCGRVSGKRRFSKDRIMYLHNQGLSLYGNLLAVFSIHHQTVHLFEILQDGTLQLVVDIGRFCLVGDEELFAEARMTQDDAFAVVGGNNVYFPYREKAINCLKHRVLAHLFKEAKAQSLRGNSSALRNYFFRFNYLKGLRLWRMQLIDGNHLLLKFAAEDVVSLKAPEPLSFPAFFVVYRICDGHVLSVLENTSPQLLAIFEDQMDHFRQVALNPEPLSAYSQSAANNIHAQALHVKMKQMIVHARHGGPLEAVRRVLLSLPYSSQCWSTSPYFDLNMFVYDEKWISPLERPRPSPDLTVKVYLRRHGSPAFCLKLPCERVPESALVHRPVAAYIFHPFEPFVLSIQRRGIDFVVSFHFRNIHRDPQHSTT